MKKCKTPGALYFFNVEQPNAVGQTTIKSFVTVPSYIRVDEERAKLLETLVHDLLEKQLGKWWPKASMGNKS